MSKYKVLIGLEMHCEISETNTKVFSSAKNDYSEIPNSNIRPVDMGFPGTLPVVNKEAIKKSLMASIILNCRQPEYLYFERKNYYYPDLPKGYQITQETKPAPIGIYGELKYEDNGEYKIAKVNNIHLEEDAGSMTHHQMYSTVNYNRAGVPLLELVTEPCFHSASEAVSFLETMRSIYQYAGISEADSKKGQIRCDVNISIMDEDKDESDPSNWGTKIEVKNVNSFGGVRESILYEIERQTSLKETNEYDLMEQQTRRWDEESQSTVYMRSKVDAIDYKYFVEPNIPKIKISKEWLEEIRTSIPSLPNERKEDYINRLGLSKYDAEVLVKSKDIADYFEEILKYGITPKNASNWITTFIVGMINKLNISLKKLNISAKLLSEIINLVDDDKISRQNAKMALTKGITENKNPLDIIKEDNLLQVNDDNLLIKIVIEVLDENPNIVNQYKEGRDNVINFLVGQVMKKTNGQISPAKAFELITTEIKKR